MKIILKSVLLSGIIFLGFLQFGFSGDSELPRKQLRNTYYYVVRESDYAGLAKSSVIFDLDGQVISQVSPEFKKAVNIEGTGTLLDGRIINYAGRKEGDIRYFLTKAPYGWGVGGCKLKAFHSVAVDPKVIPLGSEIKIAETEGMLLPDGTRHDGIWTADDVGGAIKKDRIDLFVGFEKDGKFLEMAGITNLKPLDIQILSYPQKDSCITKPRIEEGN